MLDKKPRNDCCTADDEGLLRREMDELIGRVTAEISGFLRGTE
jgi:hypothetical protein